MPNRKSFNIYLLISFLIIFNSCIPNDLDVKERETSEVSENPIQALENLSIPNGFNFETERDVTLTINDVTPYVKYEVFAYSSDYDSEAENISEALKSLLYAGKPYNGFVSQVFSLSNVYDKVYISRKDGLEYSFEIIDVLNNKIDFQTLSKVEKEFGNFEIGQVHGGGNPIYLRFGYWNRVDVVKLNEILGYHATAIEDDWYDDDCGWQYSYKLN